VHSSWLRSAIVTCSADQDSATHAAAGPFQARRSATLVPQLVELHHPSIDTPILVPGSPISPAVPVAHASAPASPLRSLVALSLDASSSLSPSAAAASAHSHELARLHDNLDQGLQSLNRSIALQKQLRVDLEQAFADQIQHVHQQSSQPPRILAEQRSELESIMSSHTQIEHMIDRYAYRGVSPVNTLVRRRTDNEREEEQEE
jgi:hypothetical protein